MVLSSAGRLMQLRENVKRGRVYSTDSINTGFGVYPPTDPMIIALAAALFIGDEIEPASTLSPECDKQAALVASRRPCQVAS